MLKTMKLSTLNNSDGATVVLVVVLMVVIIGVMALGIDIGHLYVVRAELQNAADAGALWGAQNLYNEYGTEIKTEANQEAYNAATQNKAIAETGGPIAVDINWTEGHDIQRGHWSFATKTFTPNPSTNVVDITEYSAGELDVNTDFINAIRVVARRQETPAASFFARIFGYENFEASAEAIGYIGFAGELGPGDADAPIAICAQSISENPDCQCGDDRPSEVEPCVYGDCNIGYMLSDGQDKNTAAWTNFSQPCDTADANELSDLLTCENSNPEMINLGSEIGATNGVVDSVFDHPVDNNLVDCWKNSLYDSNDDGIKDAPIDTDGDGWPDRPWNLYLPVINCAEFQVSNCMNTCGAVNLNIVWILEKENKIDDDAPYEMWHPGYPEEGITPYLWTNYSSDGAERWDDFAEAFFLLTPNGDPATVANDGFKKKSIYFLPDCTAHELKGKTGGENYGVLARIPVLVK